MRKVRPPKRPSRLVLMLLADPWLSPYSKVEDLVDVARIAHAAAKAVVVVRRRGIRGEKAYLPDLGLLGERGEGGRQRTRADGTQEIPPRNHAGSLSP